MSSSSNGFEELRFAQQLGDADENIRNKAIKEIKSFITLKSKKEGFSYEDFIKIWKGLYYCMYMSDKPLVQEDLAEEISKLIHCVSTNSQKLLFFKALLDTVAREWNGIDKYRYDKFLMLITRSLRQMLIFLSKICWNRFFLREFCDILELRIVCPSDDKNVKPLELKMHISEIILEELAKVGKEKLPDRVLIATIHPFLKVLAKSNDKIYVNNVLDYILHTLIKQSKLGIENEEDITVNEVVVLPKKAKKRLKDDELESDEEIEEDETDFVMDPRIGGVDVHLPFLRPDYNKVAAALESLAHDSELSRERRKSLVMHARKFRLLAKGVYPFNFPEVDEHKNQKIDYKQAFKRLSEFDEEITSKRRKILDKEDIEELENNQPEEPVLKPKGKIPETQMSKKKEAKIKRKNMLKKKKLNRSRKINKLKKTNPEALKKFLQQEREEKLQKKQKIDNPTKDAKLKKPFDNKDKIKSNAELKTSLQNDSSNNVISKKKKIKKSVDKIKTSNEEKFIDSNSENTGKVKVPKKKNLGENVKTVQNKLKKEDPWMEPLKEGEIEFNITKKKYSKKVKSGMLMRKTPNVNTKGRTLKINLKNNTEHEFGDYKVALKQSPGIPFSAQKKPLPSVLKSSAGPNLIKKSKKVNSRINFIRRRSKF